MNTTIKELHAEYCRLVGGSLLLTLDRQYWWGQWKARGFTMSDLRLVMGHLQRRIKDGKRYPGCLKWSHLIQQADAFEEELIEAQAEKRNEKPEPSPRELVVRQWRPTVGEGPVRITARPVSELIDDLKRAAGMKV